MLFKVGDRVRIIKNKDDVCIFIGWCKDNGIDPNQIFTVYKSENGLLYFKELMHNNVSKGAGYHYRFELVKNDLHSLEEAIKNNTLAQFIKFAIT